MPRKGDPITVSMQELRKTEEATAAKLKEQEHVIEELRVFTPSKTISISVLIQPKMGKICFFKK